MLPTPSASPYGTNQGGAAGRVGPVRPSLQTMARKMMWPTPNVPSGGRRVSKDAEIRLTGQTPTAYHRGKKQQVGLEQAVAWWPTPRSTDGTHGGRVTPRKSREGGNLIEAVSNRTTWATPSVCGNYNRKGASPKSGDGLATQAGGALNPTWVEWLMGWPIGFTDLKPLATGRFQRWLRSHGRCLEGR